MVTEKHKNYQEQLSKSSRGCGYDRESSFRFRILIALLFFGLLFFFLHFREVRVESLELDSVAEKFIVAQTEFIFLDQETTHMIRQDAVRDIGKIWRFSEKELRNHRLELEKELTHSVTWRQLLPDVTLTDMFTAVDLFQKEMQKLRFTDPRTFKTLEQEGFSVNNLLIFAPASEEETAYIPSHVWHLIEKVVIEESRLAPSIGLYLVQFYETTAWKLDEDVSQTRLLRKKVQMQIPEHYTHVASGDRIIDQGEKVQPRHLAMLQAMKRAIGEKQNLLHTSVILGSLLLAATLTVVASLYLYHNQKRVFYSRQKLILLACVVLFTLALSRGVELWILHSKMNLVEMVRYPLFVPFAAIMLCHLLNARIAAFVAGFLSVVLTLTDALDSMGLILNLTASCVAIMETRSLGQRKEVFIVAFKSWLSIVWIIFAMHLYSNTFGDVSMLYDLMSSLGFLLITAVLVIGLLPLFESTFNILTEFTLMEYMDPSHELLKRLSIEAPGTYQHSLVVGSLAEAAALAIGANGLFCRVSTLYHDIGKMATPQYFTENQQCGVNMHQLLTAEESAQTILQHVTEGVEMAKRAHLPAEFIDIIQEHHGTSLVYFFYRRKLDEVDGDVSQVDEEKFRYKGPKPRSKESCVIMIADSFEAASRSLDEISEETLSSLVEKIVQMKTQDGQLDACNLTFHELAIVKKTMVQTLIAAGHARIKYPKPELKSVEVS